MTSSKEEEEVVSGTFTWRIDNFSKLKSNTHYSDIFIIGGTKWRLHIGPSANPNSGDYFSMFLGVAGTSTLPPGWTRYAHFSLAVVNQNDSCWSITKSTDGTTREFNENRTTWGFKSFMPLLELYFSGKGYVVNDICIVKAKIDIPTKIGDKGIPSTTIESLKKEHNGEEPPIVNYELQDTPGSQQDCIEPTDDTHADPSLAKVLGDAPTIHTGELTNFKGLGQIDKAFVPLLEEVCSRHPALIVCMLKRSQIFTQCAFTALGRLLHFLKTNKVKDMSEHAFDRLQLLWEELETFRFDLAWLEPHVQSAFGMKKFVQRAGRMKRLREDVDVLENELKRRRDAVAVTKFDLEIAKRDLAKLEQDFTGIDMDSELGYGSG